MTEQYKSQADLVGLSGTVDPLTGLPYQTQNVNPHGEANYKWQDQVARALAAAVALQVFPDGDLTFGVRAGRYYNVDSTVNYAGASAQALTNNQTNYIYLTHTGTLTVNITGFPVPSATAHIPLAEIATAAGTYDITDIVDRRSMSIFHVPGNPITTTFNDHLLPATDGTYDLGSSTKKWRQVYTDAINLPTTFFNDTGVEIPACSVVNVTDVDVTAELVKGTLADASSPATSSSVIGMTAVAVPDQAVGVAYRAGRLTCDTQGMSTGVPIYLSETAGEYTTTRPQHPSTIVILGTIEKVDASGKILLDITRFNRAELSRDYSFTSSGIGSGVYYVAGFYDWVATDITLTQASLTQTLGTSGRTYAAHVGIVPDGAGTVDTGQVGLRVTGTLDSETSTQTAAQTQVITDDITTLTVDVMAETVGKFSGQVTLELYVVSGAPTTYSLTFNYGWSKYEDFQNKDFTVAAIEAVWLAAATDAAFDIELMDHKPTGWTYAAAGFSPGNTVIASRLSDQQIESSTVNGENGAWKHIDLDTFIEGSGSEGSIVRVTTGQNNTAQQLNINLTVFSEELT